VAQSWTFRVRFEAPSGTAGPKYYVLSKVEALDGETARAIYSITADADGGTTVGSTSNLLDSDAGTYFGFELSDPETQKPWIDINFFPKYECTAIALTLHSTINGSDVYGIARMTVRAFETSIDRSDHLYFDPEDEEQEAWTLGERRVFSFTREGVPFFRYYKMTVDSAHSSGSNFGAIDEVLLFADADGLYSVNSGADRGSYKTPPFPPNVIDVYGYPGYDIHWGTNVGPQYFYTDFGGKTSIALWKIQASATNYAQGPKTGSLSGSDDGSSWTEIMEFDLAAPAAAEVQIIYAAEQTPDNPGTIAAPLACAAGRALGFVDFTAALDPHAPVLFVADIIDADGNVTRVPISSWQATLQTDAKSYAQCVVPNAEPYVDAIVAGETFRVSRVGTLLAGGTIEIIVAQAPLQTYSLAQGPYNYTATVSGYADAFPEIDSEATFFSRALTGIRTFTQTPQNFRMRADIDWLLRPGFTVDTPGYPSFTVTYVNLYANLSDVYMDVGSRSE
jgi:hypothetical protein